MSEPKYAHRCPPCPTYDLEGYESWLEDLARQGLILTKSGFFFGFLEFEKSTPKPMRYRLQPLPKKRFLEDRRPTDAALELAEAYGWEYLCNMADYAIYGCSNPAARELDTDPQVQAVALQQTYKRKRRDFIWLTVVLILSFAFLLAIGPVTQVLNNPWSTFYFCFMAVAYPISARLELKQLKELKQKLTLGTPLSRTKNWRKTRWQHWVGAFLFVGIYFSLGILLFISNFSSWEDSRWQSVETYSQEIPFATITDLAGGGSFEPDGLYTEEDNHIAERATLLAPRQIKLQQLGRVTENDTTLFSGILEVEYYEMRTKWLAKELFQEIYRMDNGSKHYHLFTLPDLPTEQEISYSNYFPTLLLQDGTTVLKVQLTQFDDGRQMEPDVWAAIIARSIADHKEGF